MAAADLGIDPADIRRRNFVTSGEMPFNSGQLVTYEGPAQFNSGDYPAVFEQALTDIGWAEKRAMQGRAIDGWYHGIGFASFAESSAGGVQERARIRLGRDGTLDVFVGSTSSGQGHETVFAQVAADALQLPIESIQIVCASTDELEEGFGTLHSRSAVMSGNAVCTAASDLVERLRPLASAYFGQPNVGVDWREGKFHRSDTDMSVDLASLASFAAVTRRNRGRHRDVQIFRNEAVQLRHACRPRRRRSAHRSGEIDRFHRRRGHRPRAQPADRPWPGFGRDRAGSGRDVHGAPSIRRGRPDADRFVCRLSSADSNGFPEHSGKIRGTRACSGKSTGSQGRGRGRNSSLWLPRCPTQCPRHSRRSMSKSLVCRSLLHGCGR